MFISQIRDHQKIVPDPFLIELKIFQMVQEGDNTMAQSAEDRRKSFARRAESLVERVRIFKTIYEVSYM